MKNNLLFLTFIFACLTITSCSSLNYSTKKLDVLNIQKVTLPEQTEYFKYDNSVDSLYLTIPKITNVKTDVIPLKVIEVLKSSGNENRLNYMVVFNQGNDYYAVDIDQTDFEIDTLKCCYTYSDLLLNEVLRKSSLNSIKLLSEEIEKRKEYYETNKSLKGFTSKTQNNSSEYIRSSGSSYQYTPTTSGPRGGKKVINSKGKAVYESSTKKSSSSSKKK